MTDREPLVSIGVPVYNGERYIRSALDSILGQTYKNLEIIVSDNASTDGTEAICLAYAAKDKRIRYSRNAANIGLTGNHRRVLALASGKYFMWACADDLRPATAVQRLAESLESNPRAVMCHGPILLKLMGNNDLYEIPNKMDLSDNRARHRIRNYTKHLTSQAIIYGLFRRDALHRVVFANTYGQEYLFCLQLLLLGPFEYVTVPMIVYSTRRSVPNNNPMYPDAPVRMIDLLLDGGMRRWKCWTMLLVGSLFLVRIPGVKLLHRMEAAFTHITTFVRVYHRKMASELLFQLFLPVSWISSSIWRLSGQWSVSSTVTRKLRTLLLRSE